MSKQVYFRNTHTGDRYRVVRQFKDKSGVTQVELEGKHARFCEPFDKENFKRMGYTPEVEEIPEHDDDE